MKIAIIQFSPSGNTLKVSETIKRELEHKKLEVQLIDITRSEDFFNKKNIQRFLTKNVNKHDVLLIGGPVYAHHLQYHVKDLINALPEPNDIWGKYTIPYVTYGGISSGIALREAQKLLKKSGRLVYAGMKITASHRMTRAFLDEEFNKDKIVENYLPQIKELVRRVIELEHHSVLDFKSESFNYNGLITALKANIIFKEKVWHEKRYPKVSIDLSSCSFCGKCVNICPVLHLKMKNKTIVEDNQSSCIHCLNCVSQCPNNAIKLYGDLEKGKEFMTKMIIKKGNKEKPESAIY